MKVIPEELVSPLCNILKTHLISIQTVRKMSEEELLKLISQAEENAHIRELLASKEVEELIADAEVQMLITGLKDTLDSDIEVTAKALEILEAETAEN